MNEVFETGDTVLSESSFDLDVVNEGDSLSVNFSKTSLQDEFGDGLSGGITKSDERKNLLDHVDGGFVYSDERTVVNLSDSK